MNFRYHIVIISCLVVIGLIGIYLDVEHFLDKNNAFYTELAEQEIDDEDLKNLRVHLIRQSNLADDGGPKEHSSVAINIPIQTPSFLRVQSVQTFHFPHNSVVIGIRKFILFCSLVVYA